MSFKIHTVSPESIGDLLKELEAMKSLGAHDDQADSFGYDDSYYGYGEEVVDGTTEEVCCDGKEFGYKDVPSEADLSPVEGFKIYLDRLLTDILNRDVELDNTGEVAQLWEVVKNVEAYSTGRQNV